MVGPTCRAILLALSMLPLAIALPAGRAAQEFSVNMACSPRYCINPIFPALSKLNTDVMGENDAKDWFCTSKQGLPNPELHTHFCKEALFYKFAVPMPEDLKKSAVEDLIKKQEVEAVTAYQQHLSGMGLEFWEYVRPWEHESECIKSVWKMACMTYFPQCNEIDETTYLRPCKSVCHSYIRECQVECCDESVMCVFNHTVGFSGSKTISSAGYSPHDGPSAQCTGNARGLSAFFALALVAFMSMSPRKALMMVLVVVVAMHLQGCVRSGNTPPEGYEMNGGSSAWYDEYYKRQQEGGDEKGEGGAEMLTLPGHTTGFWRQMTDYTQRWQFLNPVTKETVVNSCSQKALGAEKAFDPVHDKNQDGLDDETGMPTNYQSPGVDFSTYCSGHGYCAAFDEGYAGNPISFCRCDPYWGGPECSEKRLSHWTATVLSVVLGWTGADQFYLGNTVMGAIKLATFGGFGVLYVKDIVTIGPSPPFMSTGFKCENDLGRLGYVVFAVAWFLFVGCLWTARSILYAVKEKRSATLVEQHKQEDPHSAKVSAWLQSKKGMGWGSRF